MAQILIRFSDELEHKIRLAIAGKKQGAMRELVETAVQEYFVNHPLETPSQ